MMIERQGVETNAVGLGMRHQSGDSSTKRRNLLRNSNGRIGVVDAMGGEVLDIDCSEDY